MEKLRLLRAEEDVVEFLVNCLRLQLRAFQIWVHQNLHTAHLQDEAASALAHRLHFQHIPQAREALFGGPARQARAGAGLGSPEKLRRGTFTTQTVWSSNGLSIFFADPGPKNEQNRKTIQTKETLIQEQ